MTEIVFGTGHNSSQLLKSFISRIEKLEEAKTAIAEDLKDVYAEAKATGLNTKIIRQMIRLRKMKEEDRRKQEELLDLYMAAIGDFIDRLS